MKLSPFNAELPSGAAAQGRGSLGGSLLRGPPPSSSSLIPMKTPTNAETNHSTQPEHREKNMHRKFGKCCWFCSKSFVQSLIGLYS